MTALNLQVLLLLTAAFFVGAAIACGLRKLFAPAEDDVAIGEIAPAAVPRPVEPLPEIAAQRVRSASDTAARFEQALTAEQPRPAPAPVVAPPPPAPVVAPPPPRPAPVAAPQVTAPPVAAAPRPAPAPVPPPAPVVAKPVPPPAAPAPAPSPAPAIAATVAAAAAAAAAATQKAAPVSVAAPVATPVTAPVTAPAPAVDDLTRIRGIDRDIAARLGKLGITRYAQIASWMRKDVARIDDAFGFRRRVEQENWIEQAQILAAGGLTAYARGGAKPALVPAPPSAPAAVKPVLAPTAPAAMAPIAPPIAPPVAQPVAPPAATPAKPAAAPAAASPAVVPVGAGIAAAAAAAAAAALNAARAPTPPPSATASAKPAPIPSPIPSAAPAAVPPPPPAQPVRPAAGPARDQLQRVSGINAEIEKLLNVQGVTRYSQIASWSSADVERFDRLLGSTGRVQRENWIEQAQFLARGGDTSASREFDRRASTPAPVPPAAAPSTSAPPATPAPATPAASASSAPAAIAAGAAAAAAAAAMRAAAAPAPAESAQLRPAKLTDAIRDQQSPAGMSPDVRAERTDISAFRSVKSEAFQSKPMDQATVAAAAAAAAAGSAKVVRMSDVDDLKRIRGIGVLIEKRLNAAGVTTYEQIASWTNSDIARFSHLLDFKGRIERENWVEQARILSSGGFTEFSRRVDRGEVETSRIKT